MNSFVIFFYRPIYLEMIKEQVSYIVKGEGGNLEVKINGNWQNRCTETLMYRNEIFP